MNEILRGRDCSLHINIAAVGPVRSARRIDLHIVSPTGVSICVDNSLDELNGVVVAHISGALLDELGEYGASLNIVFTEQTIAVPQFEFARVVDATSICEYPTDVYIVINNGQPIPDEPAPSIDVVGRAEFEALAGTVRELGDNKQDTLVSGDNIKSINGESILGSGNIEIQGGSDINIDTELSPTSPNAISNSAVTNAINELPNKKGYYPAMSVGMADNLVGRGDTQDAHINFRPSAGADNITDGAARIERIKGNTVVYNQMRYDNIAGNQYTFNVVKQERVYTFSDAFEAYAKITISDKAILRHKYLLRCNVVANDYNLAVITSNTTSMQSDALKLPTSGWAEAIVTKNINATNNAWQFQIYDNDYTNKSAILEDITIIDLTQMFGAGNEPTTVEEYLQRKPMNIADEYAHNAGTLVDMHANKIISTSDNAYDYTKHYARVMGGYKYDITANADATLVVSFYADGEDSNEEREIAPDSEGKYTFPANGICYVNGNFASESDICVCLNHSYTKPHPAYQQEVKDLSFIGEAFPNGMRSAGSAFDEIRFNPTKKVWEKVPRIGVVDLGSLAWQGSTQTAYSNAFRAKFDVGAVNGVSFSAKYQQSAITASAWISNTYPNTTNIINGYIGVNDPNYTDATTFKQAMQGVKLYYELAKPIVEEIDLSPNFNIDYLVWDFGTEEAIANVASAPFRADINYEPNAVDDLRWAVSEIRSLKAQLAQMQTSVTNLTE